MKIVVAVRCYNEEKNIDRFMRGYGFADEIIVSDGGSTDDSVSILKSYSKVSLSHFSAQETRHGHTWNPDAPHMNFVLDTAKSHNPDWLIFDDMDCVPNETLRERAREIFEHNISQFQINAFRLYLWGDTGKFFPKMNVNFQSNFASLWAWQPSRIDIRADESLRHGTLLGVSNDYLTLHPPYGLLHKSWSPDTIDAKVERYNKLGLPMNHPSQFAGELEELPEWAVE